MDAQWVHKVTPCNTQMFNKRVDNGQMFLNKTKFKATFEKTAECKIGVKFRSVELIHVGGCNKALLFLETYLRKLNISIHFKQKLKLEATTFTGLQIRTTLAYISQLSYEINKYIYSPLYCSILLKKDQKGIQNPIKYLRWKVFQK